MHDEHELHAVVHHEPEKRLSDVIYHLIDFAADWSIDSLPAKVDAVIHLAQSGKFRDFPGSALDVFRVNIEATARLLDYASNAGASHFIYASTGGVYGKGEKAFNENSPIVYPAQLGYYFGSKMCGEIMVQSYVSIMKIVILRPFFIYGPGQNRDMLIPRLMDNVSAGRPISLQGADGIRINPIHAWDAAAVINRALSLEQSATFNIAGSEVLSIRQICSEMGRYLGRNPIFQSQEGVAKDLIGDNMAMCKQLVAPKKHLLECFSDVVMDGEVD